VIGIVGGALGGLIGLGGGFIMVPLFIYLFGMSQHDAQGTSLAVLLPPVGILTVLQYWRASHVDVPVALWAALGFLVGGYLGGSLAQLSAARRCGASSPSSSSSPRSTSSGGPELHQFTE
jgi:uncharacterized membrane protein YfcA